MKKTVLILINGQSGAGKTTAARSLLQTLKNAAYISSDSLISVNPFEFDDDLCLLGQNNAKLLINSFQKNGYQYIILCGLLNDQRNLDQFVSDFNDSDFDILYVWLKADKAIRDQRRVNRARDDADKSEHFDLVDERLPNLKTPLNMTYGKFIIVDTNSKNPSKIAEHIVSYIEVP